MINAYTTWDYKITIKDQCIHNMGLQNHNEGSIHTQHGLQNHNKGSIHTQHGI